MAQLKMIWKPNTDHPVAVTLPEGYTVRGLQYEDIDQWNRVEQSLAADWDKDKFLKAMLFDSPHWVTPKNIWCVFDEKGNMASSATVCVNPITHQGNLHMVAADPAYRGKGLGKAVCAQCMEIFRQCGCTVVTLSTDDFRKPAIAIYLTLGFRPWFYEEDKTDMETRWKTILQEMQWKSPVFAYDSKQEPIDF